MTVSRSALDLALEAYTLGESTPEQRAVIADAAQAVLDGKPLDWCVVHGAGREETYDGPDLCCWLEPMAMDNDPCQFEIQVRIRVNP